MTIGCTFPSRLALLAIFCSACGSSSGAPRGMATDPRDPASAPQGAGTTTIDMEGTWRIAELAIEAWDPWRPEPAVAELRGQELGIASRPDSGFALESFGWIRDLEDYATLGSPWSVHWRRNHGDGRLLVFAFSGALTGPGIVPPPGLSRWSPGYMLGVSMGAVGPHEMLGRFFESGGAAGTRGFTFLARRVGGVPAAAGR